MKRKRPTFARGFRALVASGLVSASACGALSNGVTAGQPGTTTGPGPDVVMGPAISITDPRLGVMGRTVSGPNGLEFGYPGVTVRSCFTGPALSVVGSSNTGRSRFAVVVNNTRVGEFTLADTQREVPVWRAPLGAPPEERTCVDIVHQTETWIGVATLSAVRVAGQLLPSEPFPQRKLLFVGDSVTCGEAVARKPTCSKDPSWWDVQAAYGALVAQQLGAQYQLVCYGGRGVVRDWQGRSDTLNAPQFFPLAIPDERLLAIDLAAYVPDAVVVSLGTNDFNLALGAFPPRGVFVETYTTFVRTLLTAYPNANVFLTEGAIVADDRDSRAKSVLREYVQAVVSKINHANVTYLASKHYPGDTCDTHPTAAEHALMAAEVVEGVRAKLRW